jgi:DNA replication and repair protein RecF
LLAHLSLLNFRNLEPLKWGPGPGSHLLLGGNGAGKTSVLEAVYVLATTRSFRAARLEDCVRHNSDGFQLEGESDTDHRATLEVRWIEGKRIRLLNGRTAPLSEHLAALPIVAWTFAEAEVLVGAPKARRRFMDRGVVGIRPPALDLLNRYGEALRQKRELLLQGGAGTATAGIEVWNELLAATAAEVIRLRHAYVGRLREVLGGVLAESGLDLPPIDIRYRPSPAAGLEGAAVIAAALERAADRERLRQVPLLGPQRDELEILWGGHDIRRVASAGER